MSSCLILTTVGYKEGRSCSKGLKIHHQSEKGAARRENKLSNLWRKESEEEEEEEDEEEDPRDTVDKRGQPGGSSTPGCSKNEIFKRIQNGLVGDSTGRPKMANKGPKEK
ncbi:hypothetical protein RUM44_006011 [Polyplax serrata]|uniref:Uncharacterized protein n=1 Tax=Polyplax serrata TaxID=468196 RepID=A0ABR1AYU8_POLSC